MKKRESTILCLTILAVFLMPLMGNSVLSEGRDSLTWHFNRYDTNEAWETNPQYMVDGNPSTFASTSIHRDVELLTDNSYMPDHPDGTITKVEIRARVNSTSVGHYIYLRPIYDGIFDGSNCIHQFWNTSAHWTRWFEIYHPGHFPWQWQDIPKLDCDVEAVHNVSSIPPIIYCSIVEIRVTYI